MVKEIAQEYFITKIVLYFGGSECVKGEIF